MASKWKEIDEGEKERGKHVVLLGKATWSLDFGVANRWLQLGIAASDAPLFNYIIHLFALAATTTMVLMMMMSLYYYHRCIWCAHIAHTHTYIASISTSIPSQSVPLVDVYRIKQHKFLHHIAENHLPSEHMHNLSHESKANEIRHET